MRVIEADQLLSRITYSHNNITITYHVSSFSDGAASSPAAVRATCTDDPLETKPQSSKWSYAALSQGP